MALRGSADAGKAVRLSHAPLEIAKTTGTIWELYKENDPERPAVPAIGTGEQDKVMQSIERSGNPALGNRVVSDTLMNKLTRSLVNTFVLDNKVCVPFFQNAPNHRA